MSESGNDGMKSSGSDGNGGGGDGDRKDQAIPVADPAAKSSSSSSSIGKPSSDDDEDDAEEVKAPSTTALDSLSALENSLPMKRGLSSCYAGKSKSFGNLTDLPLNDAKDLTKEEHPINKKRRLLLAHKTLHDKNVGGSSFENVGPGAIQSDDQTEEEAGDDVEENRGDDRDEDGDDD